MKLLCLIVATIAASHTLSRRPAVFADPSFPTDTLVVIGTITDQTTRQPLRGATVSARQSTARALSGADGRFRLTLVRTSQTRRLDVHVRMLGYSPITRQIAVNGTTATVDVALAPASQPLSQVVVSGEVSKRVRGDRAAPFAVSVRAGNAPAMTSRPTGERREVAAYNGPSVRDSANREQYANLVENPFLSAVRTPLSTFSIDVDRASYSDVRRHLDSGHRPPRDAVRIEELLNYFRYDYAAPQDRSVPVHVTVETHAAPWQPSHRLVRIGMQAPRLPLADLPPANLVFLIDVSGSMGEPNKLPLVIKSLRLLTAELRAQDRVAIVVYAGAAGLVLPPTLGSDKARIFDALDRLQSGGSTNGGDGIRLAYQTAREHFLSNGANRVILATDGDFNVGTTSDSDLIQLIETERRSGVFLTVLGFGMGNTQHAKMEQLADKGNGQYAYIDDLAEAQKALVREMGGTLFTMAKDVKLQVEFNPARVRSYRLIGYENRLLRDEDFNDDTKDAGELGAGHSVTALYEVELTSGPVSAVTGSVDSSRYATPERPTLQSASNELAFVKVRYQPAQGGASKLLSWVVNESAGTPSIDYTFASAVAGFGLLLRDSEHKGSITWADVRKLAERGLGADSDGDRAGFLRLIDVADRVTSATARANTPR
jgi:Ca-activated chloride channel homolog